MNEFDSFEEAANAPGGENEYMDLEALEKFKAAEKLKQKKDNIKEGIPVPGRNINTPDPSPGEAIDYIERTGSVTKKTLPVDLESEGRFDMPPRFNMSPYIFDDIQAMTATRDEDIVGVIISIIDRLKNNDSVSIRKAFVEDLNSILIGMKGEYDTHEHIHRWMCQCQAKKPESDRKLSRAMIDLKTVKYRTISEAEAAYRIALLEILRDMDEEELNNYLLSNYGEGNIPVDTSPEMEASNFSIREPLFLIDFQGRELEFRFSRVEDLEQGFAIASRQLGNKLKRARNAQFPDMTEEAADEARTRGVEILELELASLAIKHTRARSLVKINGVGVDGEKRFVEFGKLAQQDINALDDMLNAINFGIHDERELECDLCHRKQRGWLQQLIGAMDLLPIKTDQGDISVRKPGKRTAGRVRFGKRMALERGGY